MRHRLTDWSGHWHRLACVDRDLHWPVLTRNDLHWPTMTCTLLAMGKHNIYIHVIHKTKTLHYKVCQTLRPLQLFSIARLFGKLFLARKYVFMGLLSYSEMYWIAQVSLFINVDLREVDQWHSMCKCLFIVSLITFYRVFQKCLNRTAKITLSSCRLQLLKHMLALLAPPTEPFRHFWNTL